MITPIERLLGRLAALVATVGSTQSAVATPSPESRDENSADALRKDETSSVAKLVFGRKTKTSMVLAAHASHSSYASHSSHASHYSGSSGGYTPPSPSPPPAVAPAPVPRPAPVSSPPLPPVLNRPSSAVLAKLPKVRSHWPKQVRLKAATYFNIMVGGRLAGARSVDAGTMIALVEVRQQNAIVFVEGAESPLPVERCDLVERLGGEDVILAWPDEPAPASTSTASLTEEVSNGKIVEKLLKVSSRLPRETKILEKTEIPILDSGRVIGSGTVQAGVTLRVVTVEPKGLVLMVGGTPSLVPLEKTDLVERMGGGAAIMRLPDDSNTAAVTPVEAARP